MGKLMYKLVLRARDGSVRCGAASEYPVRDGWRDLCAPFYVGYGPALRRHTVGRAAAALLDGHLTADTDVIGTVELARFLVALAEAGQIATTKTPAQIQSLRARTQRRVELKSKRAAAWAEEDAARAAAWAAREETQAAWKAAEAARATAKG